MKRKMCLLVCGLLTVGALAGCGSTSDTTADSSAATADSAETSEDTDAAEEEEKESEADEESTDFDKSSDISVVSREDGSGTRGAFIELFGVEEKDANGEKIDYTTEEAIIANSTEIVMTTVAGDDYAIGYSSLGSLNDTVKAVWIDGAEPTAENINNGSYTIARPFNIATKGDVSEITQDFINYILSADGQAIIEDNGYIKASDAAAFESNGATGKIVIAGSSSVTPVMEKLQEAYQKVNTGAEIEIQESDSTTGMTAAMDGTCDIGMASRELKDTELDGGLTPTVIAKDGIAVIVNKNNPIEELTKDQVKSIFKGDVTTWEEVEE
ncbi:MAG: substrate-binding domain-containing protein [Lachnospiraceae bacterium]|nr:substrate-binding domain-containing protein [Lachnospiraceae bacterium]